MPSERSRAPEGAPALGALASVALGAGDLSHALNLDVGGWRVRVQSNSAELIERLRHYFRYFGGVAGAPDETIQAVERDEELDFDLHFRDWPREGGKSGRKDEYADVAGGRVVHKVRTGMYFLIGRDCKVAVGRCLQNHNQVVNFVNALYMNYMLRRGYVLCHAAGVTRAGKGLAVAALSGGGKSTLALHLLSRGFSYVSNDRLLIRGVGTRASMSGVPKLPRINPGTALNNPDLASIIAPKRRAELASLDSHALWTLEEKYDVFIDEHFPAARFELRSPLDALLVLTWNRHSGEPTRCERVDLRDRLDVLAAVMKSAGPFYVPARGEAPTAPNIDPEQYFSELAAVPVYEISGRVDFGLACDMAERELGGSAHA